MAGMTMSDLGRIQWGPTLKLALGRSVSSAMVLTVLVGLFGGPGVGLGGLAGFFLYWSIASVIGVPGTSLLIKAINAMFAGLGIGVAVLAGNIMLLMLSLAVAAGDPIVYVLNRKFPALFEVEDFKLFNLQPTIFVLAERAGVTVATSKETAL